MERYFKILGVPNTASKEEVKQAYHKKMKAVHPDKLNGTPLEDTATFLSTEINEAYHYLKAHFVEHEEKEAREQEYRDWLNRQPCHFCGQTGGVIKYEMFIAHEKCMEIKKEEEIIRYQNMQRGIEEEIRKQKEEQVQREKEEVQQANQVHMKEKRKARFRKIIQYLILPFSIIIVLQVIFGINIFPFPVTVTGLFIVLGIEYVIYIIITLILEKKFDIEFDCYANIIKSICINSICFLFVIFALRFYLAFQY